MYLLKERNTKINEANYFIPISVTQLRDYFKEEKPEILNVYLDNTWLKAGYEKGGKYDLHWTSQDICFVKDCYYLRIVKNWIATINLKRAENDQGQDEIVIGLKTHTDIKIVCKPKKK